MAEKLEGEGEFVQTLDVNVEGVSKEGATTGKINYNNNILHNYFIFKY